MFLWTNLDWIWARAQSGDLGSQGMPMLRERLGELEGQNGTTVPCRQVGMNEQLLSFSVGMMHFGARTVFQIRPTVAVNRDKPPIAYELKVGTTRNRGSNYELR